jgi:hypothetical protein
MPAVHINQRKVKLSGMGTVRLTISNAKAMSSAFKKVFKPMGMRMAMVMAKITMLVVKLAPPTDNGVCLAKPCAKMVHGLLPNCDCNNKPSPTPNMNKAMQLTNKGKGRGDQNEVAAQGTCGKMRLRMVLLCVCCFKSLVAL